MNEVKAIIDTAIKLVGHENVFNYVLEDYIQLRIKEQQNLDDLDKSTGEELRKEFDQSEIGIGKPVQCIKCQIEYCKPYCKHLPAYQKYLKFKKERSKELLREIFK
jgi:hypothetical protein